MSLTEVLPQTRALSRSEKLHLIRLLAQELAEVETGSPIEPNQSYLVWSPDRAFAAAAVMLQTLEAERAKP